MGIHELEYKRLLNELKFKNEELEIIEESIHDIHIEFEEYYNNFLKSIGLDKDELKKTKTSEYVSYFESKPIQTSSSDGTELAVTNQKRKKEDLEAKKVFSNLYKQIVKKCHPDRLSQDDMDYFNKMNTKFKAATWAYNNAKWSIVIRVAQELNIKASNYKKINGHLRDEIKTVDKKLNEHKSTFGWRLYQSENKKQKDNIIRQFIFTLFGRHI